MNKVISFAQILSTLTILLYSSFGALSQDNVPDGYHMLYEQDFQSPDAINDFEMTDSDAWRATSGEESWLELHQRSNYKPRVRSPLNIALLRNYRFGSFILEANLAQTGREYGHRDLCLFFGAKDAANFYYVHIASLADQNANNVFLVNDAPRTNIATKTTEGTNWGPTGSWHKVRVERDIVDGTIKVFFDDMSTPIMEATDSHFNYGRIGFGSFDDTGRFDNIRIWGPGVYAEKAGFFK